MASRSGAAQLDPLFRLLVAYRIPIYFGGLFLIGLPLLFRALEIELPATARTVLIVVVLVVMVLTYVGERRVGLDHVDPRTGRATEEYSLRLRLSLALAALGVAVGVYVALEVSTITGLLFIIGAYFFGYMGYRSELDGGEGE